MLETKGKTGWNNAIIGDRPQFSEMIGGCPHYPQASAYSRCVIDVLE